MNFTENNLKEIENTVILLTATVDPNGMVETSLQDPNIRKEQYLNAIDFYLENTKLNIVFCENSYTNIYHEIKSKEKYKRLEYITFNGNSYNKNWGKGYGEALIIENAIKNSRIIKGDNIIIKITGRIKILNIKNLIMKIYSCKNNHNIFWGELSNDFFVKTTCFACNSSWLYNSAINHIQTISKCNNNISIEETFSRSITASYSLKIKKFYPFIDGINGDKNRPYSNPTDIIRNLNHCYSLYKINLKRNNKIKSQVYFFKWIYFLILMKVKRLINNKVTS